MVVDEWAGAELAVRVCHGRPSQPQAQGAVGLGLCTFSGPCEPSAEVRSTPIIDAGERPSHPPCNEFALHNAVQPRRMASMGDMRAARRIPPDRPKRRNCSRTCVGSRTRVVYAKWVSISTAMIRRGRLASRRLRRGRTVAGSGESGGRPRCRARPRWRKGRLPGRGPGLEADPQDRAAHERLVHRSMHDGLAIGERDADGSHAALAAQR